MKYPVPFGRHLLLERINVGGMAEVFKAKAFGVEGFERIVAVKKILPTMAEDDEFVTMFVDEARIASHLTHQNIVQIYELGKFDGNYYISMEYVAGRDLRMILDQHKRIKKPMEVAKACFVTSRVCEALEYAHKKKDPAGKDLKIIHRDVSPQNVIISFEGEVKLCDFGIAKAASRASRTQVGVLKGKFAYMSPEQVRGQATDRRSDLFALGVIFYEMLTGERLFLGESDYSTLEAVRNARVPAPTQYNAKIPPPLEKIMLKLLARDPKDRYQWASEVHEDLLDHCVQDGKIYHGRHLRNWMQENYARDIEIENAKLEEFMRLKLPEKQKNAEVPPPAPSPVVLAMSEGVSASPVAAQGIPTDVAPPRGASDTGDETGDYPVQSPPPKAKGKGEEVITSTTSNGDVQKVRRELEKSTLKPANGESPVPQVASQSPVSSLFGAPRLDKDETIDRSEHEEESDDGDPIVRPAVGRVQSDDKDQPAPISADQVDDTFIPARAMDVPSVEALLGKDAPAENPTLMVEDEENEGEMERTQWDMVAPRIGDANETLFDQNEDDGAPSEDEDATQGQGEPPSLEAEIRAAQSELIDRLEEDGVLDGGETVDAGEDSEEYVSPFVMDPSEGALGSAPKKEASRPRSGKPETTPGKKTPGSGPKPSGSSPKRSASLEGSGPKKERSIPRAAAPKRTSSIAKSSIGAASVSLTDEGAMDDKTNVSELPLGGEPTPSEGIAPTAVQGVVEPRIGFDFDDGTLESAEAELAGRPEITDSGNDDDEEQDRTPAVLEVAPKKASRPPTDRGRSQPPKTSSRSKPPRTNGATNHGSDREVPRTPVAAQGGKRRIWEIRGEESRHEDASPLAPPVMDEPRGPTPPPPSPIFTPPETTGPRSLTPDEAPLSVARSTLAPQLTNALSLRDPRVLMLIAGAVGMLALALLVTLLLTRSSTGASLHIVTEPVRAVEVKIDGKIVGTETPVEAPSLGLGLHTVELHAEGYHPYTQVVQISEAKPHTMVVPLEAIDPNGVKPREETPAEVPVEVKDKPKPPQKGLSGSRTMTEIAPPATAKIEKVPTVVLPPPPSVAPPPAQMKTTEPKPVAAPAVVAAKPAVDPGAGKAAPKPAAAPANANEAFLVIATKPQGVGVIIDGKKTNLTTPIREPLSVTPGKHIVTFEMTDGQKYSFEVELAKGETKKLVKQLR